MSYCRVNLAKTNYKEINYVILDESYFDRCNEIFIDYCNYRKIETTLPVFVEDFTQDYTEVIGYTDTNNEIVAFSLMLKYPSKKLVCADHFAWNYKNPKLKLGYISLRSECARYKRLGYDYMYMGDYYDYKAELKGFELATLDIIASS